MGMGLANWQVRRVRILTADHADGADKKDSLTEPVGGFAAVGGARVGLGAQPLLLKEAL
jgi:hypothetical protein